MVGSLYFAIVIVAYICVDKFSATSLEGAGSNLAKTLYQEAIVSYLSTSLDSSKLQITYVALGSTQGTCRVENYAKECATGDTRQPHDVDFAASDSILSENEYEEYEDLQMFPTVAVAVVPIYNLPFLNSDEHLILTADILAQIYLMNITHWSDPQILAVNPNLQLSTKSHQNLPIKVCGRQDSSGTSKIFTSYISTASRVTDFSQIGVSTLPNWRPGTNLVVSQAQMAAFVFQQNGAIGYLGLGDAHLYGVSIASIQKPDGNVVAPSAESLAYAVSEYGMSFGNNGDLPFHFTADLLNAKTALSWPIASYTYLVMRKNFTRFGGTCQNRYETVKFWYWFYTSQTSHLLANLYGFVPLSDSAKTLITNRLQTDIYCNGYEVFKQVPPPPIDIGLTPFFYENMNFMFEALYLAISPESSFNIRFVNQTSPVGLFDVVLVKDLPYTISSLLPQSNFVSFPFAAVSFCFLYNICGPENQDCFPGASTINTLALNGALIFKILAGEVRKWNDSQILLSNPHFSNYLHNITVVMSVTMYEELSILNFVFPGSTPSFVFNPSVENVKIVQTEMEAMLFVLNVPYTITFLHFNSYLETISSVPLYQNPLQISTIARPDGTPLSPSIDTIMPCTFDTYIPKLNKYNLVTSRNQGCYPLTVSYQFITKMHYVDPRCDPASQAHQNANFLSWVFKRGVLTSAYSLSMILPLFSITDQVYKKTQEQLLLITCNGMSILQKNSNYNYISTWAVPLAWVLSSAVSFSGACFAFWLYKNRLHKVVKFSQPEFMCLILFGAVLITFSLVPLAHDDTGIEYYSLDGILNLEAWNQKLDNACKTVPWLYLTGFSLEFSALFAKSLRLKKIFLAKSLRRIRITVKDMAPILVACLCACWFLCAVWTGVSPLHWQRVPVAFDATGFMTVSYAHCTSHSFAGFFSAAILLQVGCLLFAMMVCYQTRNVQEDFVENKWITIVLINMMTTIVLTVLLGFFMRESPSALFAIEAMNAFMTGFGVMFVMVVPKIQIVMKTPMAKPIVVDIHNGDDLQQVRLHSNSNPRPSDTARPSDTRDCGTRASHVQVQRFHFSARASHFNFRATTSAWLQSLKKGGSAVQ